jgi:hypothetical protein
MAEKIEPSPYQTFLLAAEPEAPSPEVANPRYWSDYNRVFYHPRSLLPLEPRFKSQSPEGSSGMGKWEDGGEAWASLKKVRPPALTAHQTTLADPTGGFARA